MIGRSIFDFIKVEESHSNHHLKFLNNIEMPFIHKSGSLVYMELQMQIIEDDNQKALSKYGSMIEISKYKEIERREQSLKILLENAKDIIYTFEIIPEPKFVYISPAIEEIFGYKRQEYYNDYMHVFNTAHPEDVQILYKKMNNELDYSKPIISRWIHKEGYCVWIEDCITPIYDNEGNLIAFEGICRDISDRKVLEEKLNYLTYHDSLTGLKNRTFYDKQVEELNTLNDLPVGIIICDLDNLKRINDNIGHDKGDEIIKTASRLLLSIESEDISISRIGGDEFAVIIRKADELKIIELCKKIKLLIENYNLDNKEWPIKISIGHAFADNSVGNMSKIFKEADKQMYANKTYKRNNECI